MATQSQLNESDPRTYGLLSERSEYEVILRDAAVHVQANCHTVEDGVLQFWQVADNNWKFQGGFASGTWETFRPVERDDYEDPEPFVEIAETEEPKKDPVEREEYEDALCQEGLSPEVASQLAALFVKNRATVASTAVQAAVQVDREAILAGLKRGEFPPDRVGNVVPPEKLKDVWQQQGDLDDGFDPNRAVYLVGSSEWIEQNRREEAAEEARVRQLREEDDRNFDPTKQQPDWLDPSRVTSDYQAIPRWPSTGEEVEGWHGKASGGL